MPPHGTFMSTCRRKATEELELEIQTAELFDKGDEAQEVGSLRKQAAAWLSAAIPPWAVGGKDAEPPKKEEGVRRSLTVHSDDLQEVLLEFDGAYDRLWNVMTDINTDLMLLQGLQSHGSQCSGLARSLRAVDESHTHFPVMVQAATALTRIREADQESFRALAAFHQELERLLSCEVWCSQEAVVALEKARERMDMANTRLKAVRKHKDKQDGAAARDKCERCNRMYKAQVTIVEELLPEVVMKIDGAIASGLANYLRAQHRRFRAGCSALEALDFSLPTLDSAANKGFAFSMQRRLISKRRRIAEQDGRGGALHRILASPADNFAVATAVAMAATQESSSMDAVFGTLVRLLDDVDTSVPMLRALLWSEVLRTESVTEGSTAIAAFVAGRVCRRIMIAGVKVSCQDKKGSRFGPHALEQAMSILCASSTAESVSELEATNPSETTKAQFRTSCVGFCHAIVDAPVESCPGMLRTVCCYLREQLTAKGASAQVQRETLYGIFSVCYLCPALRDPGAFGIVGFPQPFSMHGRDLMTLLAVGLELDIGLGDKRASKRQLSANVRQVFEDIRNAIGEFCLDVLGEVGDLGAPTSGASSASMQPMSGQSHVSTSSFEENSVSPDVLKDLEIIASFASKNIDDIKHILEEKGHEALGSAFEEELNRHDFRTEEASINQSAKKSLAIKSGRVCTLPGLARIKGGKGRLFGLKYRELRPDEEGSDEPSDEEVQLETHFPSLSKAPAVMSDSQMDDNTGVGLHFEYDRQGCLKVKKIAAGGPAERCGMIEVGDVVVDVSGQNINVYEDPLEALKSMILGRAGTVLEFGLQKPGSGQVKRVKLRRAERYGSDATKENDPVMPLLAAIPDSSQQVRPRVKVRTTFTKGQSEHNRTRGGGMQSASVRPHSYTSAPGGPRLEADNITSTGSVGSDKFELSGVGVTLRIGPDDMLYVHDILSGGPAERNGCLSHGDRVIAINDLGLEGKRFFECAKMLNGSMGTVANLDLISVGDFGLSEPQVKRVTLRRTWVPDMVWNAAGDEVAPRHEDSGDNVSDHSAKQAFVPHGVGITFTKTQNDATFSVKRVTEGGPADVAGTIKSGDIIKTVDGVSVERKTYRQFARMILGPLGSIVQLGIERGSDREQHLVQLERGPAVAGSNVVSEQSSDSMSSGDGADEPPSRRSVVPQRKVRHAMPPAQPAVQVVGVGLKCDLESDGRFIVVGVQPGGPADRSGRIFVGDHLCAVGGANLRGKSKTDLRDLIMGAAGSSVLLQVVHANGRLDDVKLTRDIVGTQGTKPVPRTTASSDIMGNTAGVGDPGVQIQRAQGGLLQICELQTGGGAHLSQSVSVGEFITGIDGVRVVHLDDQTILDLLCGVPGTKVNLSIQSADGQDRVVEVVRTPAKSRATGTGRQLDEEKSFDGGSDYGDDDSDSHRGSRGRKTGLGMSFKSNHTGMIIVRRIKEGGPAARLGIREGDTIVALDGVQLQNMYSDKKELSRLMLGYAGSQVQVTLQRKGQTKIENMVLTRGREEDECGSGVMTPVAPQESWASDQSFASINKVGLGLTFVKPDGQPGVVVKRVKEGGAAAASGRLFPGDRVMQIDGEDLLDMTSKVLTNLVMGPEGSAAHLRVRRVDGAYEHVTIHRGVLALDSDGASKYGELRSEPSLDFSVCGESRRERCGLGITFKPPDSSPGMVISRIKENGPAVGSGIESGDRLIAVDGIPLVTRSSSELSKILLGAEGTPARLEIRNAHGKIIEVEITRGASSFGLNAENSRESVTSSVDSVAASDVSMDQGVLVGVGLTFHRPDGRGGVLVKRVKDGSAAQADGRIAPGDRLLAIDGRDLGAKVSHEDLTRRILGEMGSLVHLHVQFSSGVSEEIRLQRSRTYEDHASKTERVSSASQLCGLGLTFFPPTEGDRDVVIKRVKDGGAAQASRKIVAGDRLLEIDGQQVHRLSGSELKSLLMGVTGSSCEVRIEHQNGTLENVKLVRTSRDENCRAGGRIVGIASEMSLDEVAFASAASRGERKRKVGLGMVLNECDGGQGLTIRKVKRGSASDLSGKVQAGDRLLSVDGTSLDGLKRDEIEKLVMRAVGSTSVCVLRRRDNSLDHVMLLRPEPALQTEQDADEVAEEEEEGEDEPKKLVGLGMVFLRPDNKGGRVIKRLKEGSAADAHGDVVPGDRCLSIDGKSIENMTDRELRDSNRGWLGSTAVVELRSKGGVLKTCELKRRTPVFDSIVEGCGSELSYDSSIASGLTASDTTGMCGLGLTFHEWNSVGGGRRVKRVKKGGAGDNSGRIHPGDIVQAIDGTKLENIDHRALLKVLMGPEGSIAVLNLVKASGQSMQVILTRAPRGDRGGCDQETVGSSSKDEGISPTKSSSPSSTGKSESVSRLSAPAATPKVLPTKVLSPPEPPLPARSSPLSPTPKVLAASPLSSPPDTQKKETPSSPSQMPKVLSPVPIAPLPVEKALTLPPPAQKPANPLPPPAQKPAGLRASEEAQQRLSVEQTIVGEMPAASDFKPLLMGMGAAFAQESLPDNGDDDDAIFGEPAAEGLRDDLSEMSMDDSVLGDGDDEDGSRRQCGLGITFRKHDGQRGVVVKRVKPGGGAELCGDIAPGDRVLRLDGRPLEHLSQEELASMTIGNEGSEALLEVLKASTKQEVMVSVTRIRSQRGLSFSDKEVREYSLVSGKLSRESSREDLGEEGDLDYKDGTKKVPRIARTGLGLTFKPPDGKGGVVVKRVKEDGPALHLVKEGDRIVSIDDWPLNDISNVDLVRLTLGIPGTEATLRIIRAGVGEIPDVVIWRPQPPANTSGGAAAATPEAKPSLAEDSSDSVGSQVSMSSSVAGEVAGAAKPCGIGLTFRQKSDGLGVVVKRVKEGGAAALEGSISAGDVVVSIDDTAMAGLDQTAQAKLMMGAYGSVAKLVVLKVGAKQQHTVMLPRRLTAAPSLKEDSSDSLSSISSEASTSSSVAGAAKSAGLVGIGLTFLKADKATGALPVKRVKEDGAAASSSIQPGDMVLSIDGVVLGKLDTKELTRVVMGEAGSAARLEILKRNGQRETVVLLRGAGVPSLTENSTDSLSSEVSISSSTSPAVNADGEKPVGIGLTFLNPDPATGGLLVKRVKEDGGAVNSGICPGDIVVSVDGQGPVGKLDSKALNKAMMGPPGSIAKVEVLKKGSGQRQIVVLTRGAPSLKQGSSESIGSVASVAASDVSSTSSSSSTAPKAALGFTYKASKTDGRWRASTIKGGWAQQSGMVRSGDVIVSVAGQQCTGLDFKQVSTLLQGPENSTVTIVLERDGATFSAEGRRIKS